MFFNIMIGTNDLERAKVFYDSVLGTLSVPPAKVDGHRIFYVMPTGIFYVTEPTNGEHAICANGMTTGFAGSSDKLLIKNYCFRSRPRKQYVIIGASIIPGPVHVAGITRHPDSSWMT
jgi:hypothetical protein